jgi:PAS domain S-box-containing protein
MPPVQSLWAVAEIGGRLFATSDEGIFIREGTGWRQISTGIINARLGNGGTQSDGRIFYAARGEIGWLEESAGRYGVQRIPVKGLGNVFNAVEDATGAVWLELGTSRVGRVEFGAGEPTVRFFGKDDGLGAGWVSLFVLDGVARCIASGHLLRLDATTQRFVDDQELIRRIPALADCTGRPEQDASGRLWFARRGGVSFAAGTRAGETPTGGSLPLGFEPTEFTMEPSGVIWMQARQHLLRFDPRLPQPPQIPLGAKITSVQLAASDQHFFAPGPELAALPYSDNSLLIRFAAVSSPFDPPVSFEVKLDGATDRWGSTGNVGLASFNRLKEGRYVFHVRPVIGGTVGDEARLAFTVRAPWFRTKLAWVIYISAAIGLVLLVAWLFAFLERRETARLERLVAERTAALNVTNTQLGRQVEETIEKTTALAASEERYRRLNVELESRVNERTAELSNTNTDLKREIAERQRAETAQREGEERFASFMRHLPGFAFLKDHQRRILFVNEEFAKCFGLPVPQWLGKTNDEIWPGDVGENIRRDDEAVLASGQTKAIVEEIPTRGELRTYRTIKFPIPRPAGGSWLGGISVDITELARAEAEKEKLQGQLAQAQKMESVGRLAGGVAHDFNNMLQAILGNAALALDDLPPGTPARENLEEIQKSAQRSAELTRQLLAFARKQTIQPKILDLNDTVAGMLKMLRRLIGEDVNLAWLPGADLWAVRMDPSQIDQILANLCVNARDAIAGVGKVTIETGNVTLAANAAQSLPDCVPGDYVLLAVSDNGKGMDAATRAHLFEPFFTTKELGKGTGLGLATVFGTVIQNQGMITVDSEPGHGTTFKIYLPRAKAEAVAAAQESARRSLRGTETVLLVEDEEQILNLGRRILQQYGYTVLALSTPQAALTRAAQHAGPIHLLITDVVMPGMNGKELRDRIKAGHPQLKCLFMSGYTADVIADNGVLVDGVHFIQKPFTIESLVETVRRVCEAG